MNELDRKLEVLRHKLADLYLQVRSGEAREEDALKLSKIIDILLVEKMRLTMKNEQTDEPSAKAL